VRELPENRGPAIRRYIALAHCGAEGDPWCAVFANAMLESAGIRGTRSALARSFERDPNFVKLAGPALGCIVTCWRGVQAKGLGHVGFYNGEHNGFISTLGGNESDMVRVEDLRTHGSTFGLSGYYWPRSVALPVTGALPMQSASVSGSGKVT
jgi:uncharacterized protein (TIGR02594 family)